ncbi:uncharacterized protein [Montipora capricornis]|uniref:uncharacterized protein isoform X1 n=1 Tax=Montipora capricornis TaxID=246305 RepID=UPI0035F215AB
MARKIKFYSIFSLVLCCLAANNCKGRNPPKIVSEDGNLVLQAGEDGDIVFEPGQGKQVFLGGNVLNASGAAGPKGEKGEKGIQGDNGSKGEKGNMGPPGQTISLKGNTGSQGPPGKNGTDGIQGPPGLNGSKGEPGVQGPPGPLFNTIDQSTLSCNNSSDYGLVRFLSGVLQVCTMAGWHALAYQDSLCQFNVPKMNLLAFQSASLGILLQFNGNTLVNLSPTIMNITNMTTGYETNGGRNTTQYVHGIMGQAVQLRGIEFINLHRIPAGFWSNDEWSVMGLMKFHDDGVLPASKDIAVLGDGEAANYKGLHLGLRRQKVLYGFYSNDILGVTNLDYNKWYHVTWTWTKVNKMRKIFINGKLDKEEKSKESYIGISGKTEIGTWWNGNNGHTKTNVEIDTLYIINKAIDYSYEQQLCFAKALSPQLP